jgi:hypothetical protein
MSDSKHWWEGYPWRMIQTNLREPDMADMDAKRYVRDVKEFGATVVMLNAAGIVASYGTKVPCHTPSQYLTGDSLCTLLDECHREGIRVIARTDFSKVRYPLYEAHPDWAYRTADGEIVNCNGDVQVCPSSGYLREGVYDILRELLTTLPFDGIFFNMSGAFVTGYGGERYGPCMCQTCRSAYQAATGQEPPKGGLRDPNFMKYLGFQAKQIQANKVKQYRFMKELNPKLAVNGFDYTRTECNTDIGRGPWVYGSSSNARQNGGWERVVDNASVDFMSFRYRDSSVSPALMALRQWQSLANGGGLSLYIMGRLDNHRDVSGFAPTKRVFQFHRAHEEVFRSLHSAAEVVLVQKGGLGHGDPETQGWLQALTESHVPFDEVKLPDLTAEKLRGKKVIILGGVGKLSEPQKALLNGFAQEGGTVIVSGDAPGLDCLGIKALGECKKGLMSSVFEVRKEDERAFPRCVKAPMIPTGPELQMAEFKEGTERYLRLIPEHPYGPPERCYCTEVTDHPGVTVHRHGAGQGLYIPWGIGTFYFDQGWQNTLNLMQDVLFSLCGLPELAPGLSPMVELTLAKKEGAVLAQLVNGTGCFANRWFPPVSVRDIWLELPGLAGKTARALNGGKVLCETNNDSLTVRLNELNEYEAIIIE